MHGLMKSLYQGKRRIYLVILVMEVFNMTKPKSLHFTHFVVMAAELAHHFFPHHVDLHNYPPANSTAQKLNNWKTLNRKNFQDGVHVLWFYFL